MKIYLIIFVLFFIGLMRATNSFAYSCKDEEIDVYKLFEQNDVAFIGVVKKKLFDFSLKKDKYLVQVKSLHKGRVGEQVIVWTGSKCRAYFALEEEYVIFLDFKSGKLWTDLNRSWRVFDKNKSLTDKFLSMDETIEKFELN